MRPLWAHFLRGYGRQAYNFRMGRPYGKIKRKTVKLPKPPKDGIESFKIKLRGKDNTPLSMKELQQGLYEAARQLKAYGPQHRVKWATLYLSVINEDGSEIQLNAKNELVIYPYKCAADEYGD
jgi:hypothetical protein